MNLSIPEGGPLAGVLLASLIWGLAGGFSHCIGMCGIFVLSCAPIEESSAVRRLIAQLAFQCGRIVMLTLLGAAAGAIGSLVGLTGRIAHAQGVVSVVVGALITLLALGYVGIFPRLRIPEPDVLGAGGGAGRRLFASLLRARGQGVARPLALGAMVGLLPCGLTYTILIPAAATLSAARGALVLLVFGLGTIPGLLALGMSAHLAKTVFQNPRFRVAMTRLGALVMLFAGLAMIWRGWPNLH